MKNLIIQAKILYSKLQILEEQSFKIQLKIADLACAYCKIKPGNNHLREDTMAEFARETGINKSTLADWVLAFKKVIPVVGEENIKSNKDWQIARRISGDNRKKDLPKEKIKDFFEKFKKGEKPLEMEFQESVNHIKKLMKFLKEKDLNGLSFQNLIEMEYNLDKCSDIIDNHLRTRKESNLKIN